jgi:hypothetical protein
VPVLLERYGPEATAHAAAATKSGRSAISSRSRELGTAADKK